MPRKGAVAQWVHNVGVFTRALLLIVAAQLVQIACWAALFVGCGEFEDFATAFYHSAANFTTLGYGDIVMSRAGMLMFGVSTAVLFGVIEALVRGERDGPGEGEEDYQRTRA